MPIQTAIDSISNSQGSPFGFKNRIINGAMVIDQRNAAASLNPADLAYSLDRWKCRRSQSSKYTVQQNAGSVTPPVGFTNYLGVTSSSSYSVVTGDYFAVQQLIEGFNTADLAWGTSNAQTVTLSFWVRSSLTGTFGGALNNRAEIRAYGFTYTINSANTWEYKTITIAGDTTGTWLTNNDIGLYVNFNLGSGSTYGSASNGSWTAGSTQFTPSGTVSVVGTNTATWYVTGVQLEKGTQATAFDYRDYGNELRLCQRYFETNQGPGWQVGTSTNSFTGEYYNNNAAGMNTYFSIPIKFAVYKRATPSVTLYSPNTGTINKVQTNYSTNLDAASVVSTAFPGGFSGGMGASPGGAPSVIAFNWTAATEL
jgi:hypothetical protein